MITRFLLVVFIVPLVLPTTAVLPLASAPLQFQEQAIPTLAAMRLP